MLVRTPLLALLAAAALLPAAAAEPQTLKLDPLITEALRNNPEIAAAQKRYEASTQRPMQASSPPDPMLSFSSESTGSPLPAAGLGQSTAARIGLMGQQEIPAPGKLRLRGAIATTESKAEFERYQQTELNVVSRVKQAYYRLFQTWAASDVIARNQNILEQILRISEARYSVGKAQQQDIFKLQTQLTIMKTGLMQYEQERRSLEAELNSLLNRQGGSPLGRPEPLALNAFDVPIEKLYAAARRQSPMLKRDQKSIEGAELGVALARKDYIPDFNLGGGFFSMGSMPAMYALNAGLSLPAYFARKQRPAVAGQTSNAAAAKHEYETSVQKLQYGIEDDYAVAETSEKLAKAFQGAVIPQARLALESSLSSYQTGSVELLSVFENFMTVFGYEMNYYTQLTNHYLALARLEEMTAEPLTD